MKIHKTWMFAALLVLALNAHAADVVTIDDKICTELEKMSDASITFTQNEKERFALCLKRKLQSSSVSGGSDCYTIGFSRKCKLLQRAE